MPEAKPLYRPSELDGAEKGFFVVINVDSPYDQKTGCIVCETSDSINVFASLADARRVCEAAREESGNDQIFVYALVGAQDALERWPDSFEA